MDPVKIPFGYRRIEGQTRKGDGVWHADEQKFRKVRKEYPCTYAEGRVFIRRCAVEQTELLPAAGDRGDPQPATVETMELE